MQALVDDLVDFNRVKFGLGLNIEPAQADVREVFADKLVQLRAAYPHCRLELEVKGDVRGFWDGRRLQQVLGNLVENAVKYGASDEPVLVTVEGRESDLLFCVRNLGPAIDPSSLPHIFNPLTRGPKQAGKPDQGGLGLGLYIASQITRAHGGQIEARSDEMETVFTVRLPRRQAAQA